jgi:hypothetical protein
MSRTPSSTVASEPALPQLSWRSFLLALAVVLAIFFGLHPLWEPLDMAAMDANILWSYVPIPLLVLGLLAWEHKLRWASFLMETVRLTLVKFVITFLFANILWALTGPPPAGAAPDGGPAVAGQAGRFEVREPPPATPIDPADTGRLEGLVVDAAGLPVEGAFVLVAAGLEGLVFAPRSGGVELAHDGTGLQPRRAIVQVFETLVLRGAPGAFHTVCAIDVASGRQLFNVPLVSEAESTFMFHRPQGRVSLTCSVHGHNDQAAQLEVVAHPFAAWTAADGRFAFEGVPAADGLRDGALRLEARSAWGDVAELELTLHPGDGLAGLRLQLP